MDPVDPLHFSAAVASALGASLLVVARRPDWVVRFPRSVLLLLLAVTLGALSALVRLDPPGVRLAIDASTEALLPAGDPATDAYREAVRDFGDDDVFVIAMETDDVFRAEHLESLRRVGDAIWNLDGIRSVTSLARVTTFRFDRDAGWIEVRPFLDDVPTDAPSLAALRERALSDPLYRRLLVSEDGRAAAVNVGFRKMTDAEFIAADLDGRIRDILADEESEGRRFHVSGRPHIKTVMYHTMTRDLAVLIPVALLVVAVVLTLVVGTVRGVVLPLGTVAVGVLWTFGAIAFLDRPLTILTVLLAPTLVAIGSVYGLHVLNRYEEEVSGTDDPRVAARRTLDHMIVPVLIAGLTTMVGFAALLITDVPAVFEIGAFSILGIGSITLISLTGIPAAVALLPLRRARSARLRLSERIGHGLDRSLANLAARSQERAAPLIAAWGALALVSALAIPQIVIDTDYLSFFDERAEVRREFQAINRLLAGTVPLYVVLGDGRPGSLRDPALLRAIEDVEARIEALPAVSRAVSALDTLRVLNRAIAGDDPAEERIPDTRAGVTELLLLLPKDDMQPFLTVDQSRANLVVRTGAIGSAALGDLTRRIEALLADADLPAAVAPRVTGNAILLNRAADGVARGQPRTVGIAALTIFVLLAAGLRSLRLGLVAMVPNVVPVLIFFGALGLGAASLSLPTSLIGSVALGIAIDATAHYLVRYRAERRLGRTPEEAASVCGVVVGRPIAVASAMLILGFLSITLSEFGTLTEFGSLSAFTMAICGLTDLALLPALLVKLRL